MKRSRRPQETRRSENGLDEATSTVQLRQPISARVCQLPKTQESPTPDSSTMQTSQISWETDRRDSETIQRLKAMVSKAKDGVEDARNMARTL